jgi:hypothetical protein
MFENVIKFEQGRSAKEFTFNSLTFVVLITIQLGAEKLSMKNPFLFESIKWRNLNKMKDALNEILKISDTVSKFDLSEAITKILDQVESHLTGSPSA